MSNVITLGGSNATQCNNLMAYWWQFPCLHRILSESPK